MQYINKDCTLSVKRSKVIFDGKITECDLSMIDFLETLLYSKSRLTLDLTSIDDLNAMGITALAKVIEKSPQYITIKVNKKSSWQKPTLSALNIIKPGGIRVISE